MFCVRYIVHLQRPKLKFSGGTKNIKMVSLTTKMFQMFPSWSAQTIDISVYIESVAGLTKRDARPTLKHIAHSVCILSGSAHNILTQQ